MMIRKLLSLAIAFFCFSAGAAAQETNDRSYVYERSFSVFIKRNTPAEGFDAREIVSGNYVSTNVFVKSVPVKKKFELLPFLLQGKKIAAPDINHSVFVGDGTGVVLNTYLADSAVSKIKKYEKNALINITAFHLYNFELGPRLIILDVADAR